MESQTFTRQFLMSVFRLSSDIYKQQHFFSFYTSILFFVLFFHTKRFRDSSPIAQLRVKKNVLLSRRRIFKLSFLTHVSVLKVCYMENFKYVGLLKHYLCHDYRKTARAYSHGTKKQQISFYRSFFCLAVNSKIHYERFPLKTRS